MPYFILSTALFLAGIVIIHWLHNQYHLDIHVEPASVSSSAPFISVCIPARNEERNIRACVEASLNQDYPNFEVIVLDDRSADSTREILRDILMESDSLLSGLKEHTLTGTRAPSLQIISGSDLPTGWAGKPHALFQASAAARGEWLCFVDADTLVAREALSSCYAKAVETNADLFTVMTFQVLGSFWEKTIMPLIMTALSVGFSPRKVNDPHRKDAIANGQFILIKRSVYDAVGGHESVKDKIAEDKALAERVKWQGYRLIVADGANIARTRMYTSLPEMWEGWTKNIYLGLRDQPWLALLGVFGACLTALAAFFLPVWPLLGVFWFMHGGNWMALTVTAQSLVVWGVLIHARARAAIRLNISPLHALTVSLGAAVFGAMMLTSAWKVISRKGVTWKGRVYSQT